MYVPRHNRVDDPERLRAFVAAHPFAILTSAGPRGPEATHLPLLLEASRGAHGTLLGHMARVNPHAEALVTHPDVLAVFHGPHAFVSASWYDPPRAVSTWDYAAVHLRGRVRLVHDPQALHALVERLRAAMDVPETQAMPYDEKLLRALVGFEVEVTEVLARFKLSQDKDARTRTRIAEALRAQGGGAGQVAELMGDA